MKTYVGTKIINAEPMHHNAFLTEKGSERLAVDEPGYKVVYDDGYISWSPKLQFETHYRELTENEFGVILAQVEFTPLEDGIVASTGDVPESDVGNDQVEDAEVHTFSLDGAAGTGSETIDGPVVEQEDDGAVEPVTETSDEAEEAVETQPDTEAAYSHGDGPDGVAGDNYEGPSAAEAEEVPPLPPAADEPPPENVIDR